MFERARASSPIFKTQLRRISVCDDFEMRYYSTCFGMKISDLTKGPQRGEAPVPRKTFGFEVSITYNSFHFFINYARQSISFLPYKLIRNQKRNNGVEQSK